MSNGKKIYNSLHQVEKANDVLMASDVNGVLQSLREVILDNKIEEYFGIRLMHRHNSIDDNELMIEFEEVDERGNNCLSTIATSESQIKLPYHANSWVYSHGKLMPMEFSLDKSVEEANNILAGKPRFFSDFNEVTVKNGLGHVIGPCVVRRDFFQKYFNPSMILVETTQDERRANILRFSDRNLYPPSCLIPTSWIALRGDEYEISSSVAQTACQTQNCVTHTACVRDSSGGHSEQSHHSSQHVYVP